MLSKPIQSILLLALAVWVLACSQQRTPENDNELTFRSVPATEADNFLRADTLREAGIVLWQNPDSNQVFRLLQAPPAAPNGWYRAAGRLSASVAPRFNFISEKGDTCSFELQIPGAGPDLDTTPGGLTLRAGSTAAGADERLELWLGQGLRFGYCWQTAAQALSIPAGQAPLLRQLPLRVLPRGNALADVPVELRSDAGPVRLRPGERRSFRWNGQAYAAVLRSSLYLSQAEDGQRGYVLQALVWRE